MTTALPILGVRHKRQADADERLFTALKGGWSISYACEVSGYDPVVLDMWRKQQPEFDLAILGAIAWGRDSLEDRAKVRAFHGTLRKTTEHPQTGIITKEYEVSDSLAALILKAEKPDKYGTKPAESPIVRVQHSGPNGGPIEVETRVAPKDKARAVAALLAGADPADLAAILGG